MSSKIDIKYNHEKRYINGIIYPFIQQRFTDIYHRQKFKKCKIPAFVDLLFQ